MSLFAACSTEAECACESGWEHWIWVRYAAKTVTVPSRWKSPLSCTYQSRRPGGQAKAIVNGQSGTPGKWVYLVNVTAKGHNHHHLQGDVGRNAIEVDDMVEGQTEPLVGSIDQVHPRIVTCHHHMVQVQQPQTTSFRSIRIVFYSLDSFVKAQIVLDRLVRNEWVGYLPPGNRFDVDHCGAGSEYD